MPAEWEPHEGLLLCYPRNGHDWPGKYGAIEWAFVEFILKVSASLSKLTNPSFPFHFYVSG